MKWMINRFAVRRGAPGKPDLEAEAALTVDHSMASEDVFKSAARLGMAREGRQAVRVADADADLAASVAALVVTGFCHGAFRLSTESVRALAGARLRGEEKLGLHYSRDVVCDYRGSLILECEADVTAAVAKALRVARCEGYARMLGMLPNNLLRIDDMVDYLTDMAAASGLKCEILRDDALREARCGGILAVNRGSGQQAALAVLSALPEHELFPAVALVGKGVMFDAGGYHLKSVGEMRHMQSDMCGAAVAAELMELLRQPDRAMYAVIPLVENVVGPEALKMGDVVCTSSGQTVEVYNTDAEGRLILCDALTRAQRLGAGTVIDIATLTYGAQSALGDEVAACFCNDPDLSEMFLEAASAAIQPAWPLPLDRRYHRALEWSEVADFANYAPGYGASACTAAAFLEKFIDQETSWLHIDAVGPSVRRGACDWECKGATGYGLRALAGLLEY